MNRRALIASAAAVAVLAPLVWLWAGSLIPGTYSMAEAGYADYGGGSRVDLVVHGNAPRNHPDTIDVTTLTGPQEGPPDAAYTLVARAEQFELGGDSARPVEGYTLNRTSPGPQIRVSQGDLVEVRLVNESVAGGVTLHWHGVDVPNAEDGVAGVTQDGVGIGADHVYRFVAEDAGTYWYHSHQLSHEQVRDGLWGTLVVDPVTPSRAVDLDLVAPVHTYDGQRTVAGRVGEWRVDAASGATARVRLVNTNEEPLRAWVTGSPYRVVAVDGTDVHAPTEINGKAVLVTAGARVDLELTVPTDGSAARVAFDSTTSLVLGPSGADAPVEETPSEDVDLLTYGSPAPLGFDPAKADRNFEYRIGRRPGFLDGKPGLWWTINGRTYPDVPMFMVEEGDVVRMTIVNESGGVHPMHLHGHHAVVLSRNDEPASGSPWWVDSLNVEDGESYEIAFLADNPGIWMDHCHNLPHAAEGLVAHVSYAGVDTPFLIGGEHANHPE